MRTDFKSWVEKRKDDTKPTNDELLADLKLINDILHTWDSLSSGYTTEDDAVTYWKARNRIRNAGYDIHEVNIWHDDNDKIIRRDLAITPTV